LSRNNINLTKYDKYSSLTRYSTIVTSTIAQMVLWGRLVWRWLWRISNHWSGPRCHRFTWTAAAWSSLLYTTKRHQLLKKEIKKTCMFRIYLGSTNWQRGKYLHAYIIGWCINQLHKKYYL